MLMSDRHTHEPKAERPERRRYLTKKPLPEALSTFLGAVTPPRQVDHIAVEDSLHRTTAEPIFALLSAPHYHGAAMDGIAVRAEDTFGASEFSAVTLNLAGAKTGRTATDESPIFQYVDTGNPLP